LSLDTAPNEISYLWVVRGSM